MRASDLGSVVAKFYFAFSAFSPVRGAECHRNVIGVKALKAPICRQQPEWKALAISDTLSDRMMETLFYSRIASPVGPLLVGVSATALVTLDFDRGLPAKIAGQPVQWELSEQRTRIVQAHLVEYFAGDRRNFDLALDLRGTEFYRRCWNELLRIPYGETRTYAEIARAVGCPNGFRAVGQANHHNPIAIIVPCHRVLASGGRLGGYGGGLPVKAQLLRLEGAYFREEPQPQVQLALMGN